MSESKHTPGPWTIKQAKFPEEGEYDFAINARFDGAPFVIAEAFGRCSAHITLPADANARLIAAAPELLTGIQALYRAYISMMESGRDRIIDLGGSCDPVDRMEEGDPALIAARDAVAKATGSAS